MNVRRAAAAVLGFTLLLSAEMAAAHPVGLSRGEYRALADGLQVELTVARPEAIAALPLLDPNNDGTIDVSELDGARSALDAIWVGRVRVSKRGAACPGVMNHSALTEQDGLLVRAAYHCSGPPGPLDVRVELLDDLTFGHRHAAHIVSGVIEKDELCTRAHASFEVPGDEGRGGVWSRPSVAPSSAFAFLRMGFEHILAGNDHIVFLFALVLAGGRLRSMALLVTAFTAGHSVALALAVLGVVSLPAGVVEPAIALSIAYVGVENLLIRTTDRRWRITFPFGLVHGFGFAGALAEVYIPRPKIALALVTFNGGVEVGQLVILAALLPLVVLLRRARGPARQVVPALSVLVVLAGLGFFVDRVWDAIHPVSAVVLAQGAM